MKKRESSHFRGIWDSLVELTHASVCYSIVLDALMCTYSLLFCHASCVHKLPKTIFFSIYLNESFFHPHCVHDKFFIFFYSLTKCTRVTKILFIHKYCFTVVVVWDGFVIHQAFDVYFFLILHGIVEFIVEFLFFVKRGKKWVWNFKFGGKMSYFCSLV